MIDNADKISDEKYLFHQYRPCIKNQRIWVRMNITFFIVSRTPATWRKWIKYTVINRFAQILSINSSTQWRTFECCKLNCGVDEYNF